MVSDYLRNKTDEMVHIPPKMNLLIYYEYLSNNRYTFKGKLQWSEPNIIIIIIPWNCGTCKRDEVLYNEFRPVIELWKSSPLKILFKTFAWIEGKKSEINCNVEFKPQTW